MRAIVDTEWNGWDLTKLWCVVFRDIDTNEVTLFEYPIDKDRFIEFSKQVEVWIGHNFIGFDRPALLAYFDGLDIPVEKIIDTLVVSKFLNNSLSGHSLEDWGLRIHLKTAKIQIVDFSVYTPELRDRCISDTDINLHVYRWMGKYLDRPEFQDAIRTEHFAAYLCRVLHDTGFAIDETGVKSLHSELVLRLSKLDTDLKKAFPPKKVLSAKRVARETAFGTVHAVDVRILGRYGYTDPIPGWTYELWDTVEFNPGSLHHCLERLNEAGWRPTDKTKGHIGCSKDRKATEERRAYFKLWGWKLSDENLLTVPDTAPLAVRTLTERLLVSSRVKVLEAWLKLTINGRVHGTFWHIGAWTGRMSHSEPNMANVPKVQDDPKTDLDRFSNDINARMRACWIAPKGKRLIGVDADGIQMRIFAHYVNDKRLTEALVNGKKELKTSIHFLHMKALGDVCKGPGISKRFIYAWLLGAGGGKVAEILDCSFPESKTAIKNFLEFYPGLKELKRGIIPADAKRGYFTGLDGRPVVCDDEHLMLAGYLQNGEAVVMKRAQQDWYTQLKEENIPFDYVNFVHDEWQTETEDDDDLANYIADTQISAIVRAGVSLGLNCPLAGTKTLGYNWQETH